ncbi:MAG: PHP domain-containing protein [bacterium]
MIKAALHVHSTYSDGEFTLSELREKFLAAGCALVGMADHADAFDAEKVRDYIDECARLSDDRLRFMPGLEFGCVQRMHIVGYGVTALIDSTDPATVIAHIRSERGVAVIAHPPAALFDLIENLELLPDGIEGWNSKYDGRYAPRPETFELIGRLQVRRPPLRAFYGQDLHWRKQYAGLFNLVDVPAAEQTMVLDALRQGAFEGGTETVRLPSDGRLSPGLIEKFALINARSQRFRNAVRSVKKLMGGAFKLLPTSAKAQLRRFF